MENSEKEKLGFFGTILKGLAYFLNYLRLVIYDFINSFRYNNMKLASLLVAIPGLVIGFFLKSHAVTIKNMAFIWSQTYVTTYESGAETSKLPHSTMFPGMPFDYTGLAIFLLMLFGILNVFFALGMSNKKNLGSVVGATVLTSLLFVITGAYIYAIEYYKTITTVGVEFPYQVEIFEHLDKSQEITNTLYRVEIAKTQTAKESFDANYLVSIVSIIVCDVLSAAGCVLGFIFYDRTYEKIDR